MRRERQQMLQYRNEAAEKYQKLLGELQEGMRAEEASQAVDVQEMKLRSEKTSRIIALRMENDGLRARILECDRRVADVIAGKARAKDRVAAYTQDKQQCQRERLVLESETNAFNEKVAGLEREARRLQALIRKLEGNKVVILANLETQQTSNAFLKGDLFALAGARTAAKFRAQREAGAVLYQ